MANSEAATSGREVLLFLVMEKIPKSRLGTQLLYQIQNNTYMPYPPANQRNSTEDMNRFWDALVRDIEA